MRIEKQGDFFVAIIKFEERGVFKRAGWMWNPTLKKWVTASVQKASEFKEFSVGEARAAIEVYVRGEGAIVAASMAHDSDIVIPAPPGLEYLPFQRAGIAYALSNQRPTQDTLIADPPGLGKTIQAIGIGNAHKKLRDVLIVCPASLKKNWEREFKKWDVHGLSVGIVRTITRDKLGADGQPLRKPPERPGLKGEKIKETVDVFPDTDVVIMNKELFERHNDKIKGFVWDLTIIDEAHAFSNKTAKSSMHIWGGGRGKNRVLPIMAKRRIFLTGTPMTTSPVKMWAFVQNLDPKGLGRDWRKFVDRYCDAYETDFGIDVTGASNLPELNIALRNAFMVRRDKKEVLKELPPKRREIVLIDDEGITKQVRDELSQARKMLAEFEAMMGIENPEDTYDALNRLLPEDAAGLSYEEVAARMKEGMKVGFEEFSAYRKALAIAKAPFVVEHVKRLVEAGEKVILFCYHKEVAAHFRKMFNNAAFVTGDTPTEKRQDEVDRFQDDPDCMVFIGNLNAAGVGYTLTASSIVVFAELSWIPSDLEQAEDRAWRIGQDNAVLIQYLVVDGSLDARMIEVVIQRIEEISQALDPQYARH
jgi:SNF2 family DNA or RNA helicase